MNIFKNCIFLQKFLFVKVYKFYVKTFREKYAPQYFALGIVAFLFDFFLDNLWNIYRYIQLSDKNIKVERLPRVTFVIILSISILIFKDRYKEYIKEVDELSLKQQKYWKIVTWIYVILIFAIQNQITELTREIMIR